MKISVDYLQVYIPVFFMVLPKDLDCRWNSSKSFFNFFNPGPGQKTRKTMLDFTTLTRSLCQFFNWCKYWYEKRERKACIHPFVQDCIIYFQKFIFRETDSSIVPIHENLKDPWKMFFSIQSFPFMFLSPSSFKEFFIADKKKI